MSDAGEKSPTTASDKDESSTPRLTFPKSRRILRRKEFVHIQRRGKRYNVGPLLVCVRLVEGQATRIGITTSKRVGRAVFRTRVRRLIREAARRLLLPAFPEGFEIVFIAKNDLSPSIAQQDFDDAVSRLVVLLTRKRG